MGAKDRAIVKRIRNSGYQDYATFFMKARRERVETRRTFTNNAGSERLPRHDENTFAVRLDSPSPNTPQLATGSFIPDDCARRRRARSAASISQNSYRPRFPASCRIGVWFRHRPNVGAQLLPGAAATQERRLYAVGYRALLRLFDLPLHDGSHFTLTGSGIAEEW